MDPVGESPLEGKYTVRVLARAANVLATLATRSGGQTLDELNQVLGLSKASLLRILRTFEDERLVRRVEDRYALGAMVLDLSHAYLRDLELTDAARPHMVRLAEATGQTISLAVRDGLDVVYIAIERAQQEVGIQSAIGARHPVHATALGKVLLTDIERDRLDALLRSRPLTRLTHRTIVDPAELVRHIERVRRAGGAIDDEERGIGIRCIAAPVRRADGRVIAGLSVAGPIFHMTDEVLPTYRRQLMEAAAAVGERFGYVGEAVAV